MVDKRPACEPLKISVKDKGKEYQITSAFVEAWKNVFPIIKPEPGTYPRSETYVRTSTTISLFSGDHFLVVGRYGAINLLFNPRFDCYRGVLGVVPCVPAEVGHL